MPSPRSQRLDSIGSAIVDLAINRPRFIIASALFIALVLAALIVRVQIDTDPENMLPTDFKVYVQGDTVINHAEEGFEEKTLPTVNVFTGSAGCYVACYSRDAEKGVYGVGGGIFVNGQVRVEGAYKGRTCLPAGYETADISAEQSFKELCGKHVASCGAKCWAGGDTGGWFGAP